MPGRPGCPVRLEGQALGHWKTQQPIWGHGRALPPGGSTDRDPPNLLARVKVFLWTEMLKRSCCPISHQVLIWQQLRNFQSFELPVSNTTITELWPKIPKIEISSHVEPAYAKRNEVSTDDSWGFFFFFTFSHHINYLMS